MNKTNKFERNSSLEYYHMTCTGKKKKQAKEVYFISFAVSPAFAQ